MKGDSMYFFKLLAEARSCRRFRENEPLPDGFFERMAECARLSPCAGNAQRLRFAPVISREGREAIFPALKWAAYFADWPGPMQSERPAGYMVIMEPEKTSRAAFADCGIAAQSMNLYAASLGVGCCILMAFDHPLVYELLGFPCGLTPALTLAFGFPAETRVIENARSGDSLKYWRDAAAVHHVPKLAASDLLLPAI